MVLILVTTTQFEPVFTDINGDVLAPAPSVISGGTFPVTASDTGNNSYTLSLSVPDTNIERNVYVHLRPTNAATSIIGATRLDTRSTSTGGDTQFAYVVPTTNGGIITEPADTTNRYALRTRATFVSLTSVNSGNDGDIILQALFSRPVTGLSGTNFGTAITAGGGITPTGVSFGSASPDSKNRNQLNIRVTVAGYAVGYTGTITFNVENLDTIMAQGADGTNAPISTASAPPDLVHSYTATAPIITSSDASLFNAPPVTRGRVIQWRIEFDQAVTGVLKTHFTVPNATVQNALAQNATTNTGDNVSETAVWLITANFADSGATDPIVTALTFRPTSAIRGSRRPLPSSGTVGRLPYDGTDPVEFDATIIHQTLAVTQITADAYTNTTDLTPEQRLFDHTTDNRDTAIQAPGLIRYRIHYNLPPQLPTIANGYGVFCSVTTGGFPPCPSTRLTAREDPNNPNIHIIDVTNPPTDLDGAVRIRSENPDTLPTGSNITARGDVVFQIKPRVTMSLTNVVTDTEALIRECLQSG